MSRKATIKSDEPQTGPAEIERLVAAAEQRVGAAEFERLVEEARRVINTFDLSAHKARAVVGLVLGRDGAA